MNNNRYTIIHFDYGGNYSKNGDDIRWISREDQIYTLVMKSSIDKVTYLGLVDRLSKKILIDEATTKMRISYIPLVVDPKRPSYILDDEEVFGYLMEVNKDQCRSVLHIELEQNQVCEKLSREDRTSDVGVSNEELISNGRVNDGITTPNAGEHYENASCEEELANMDNFGMMYEEDANNAIPDVEDDQYLNVVVPWEDGIDITLGQEFESKQAVQDLVEKAAHLNSFDFATIKSESKLYVLKCCEEKNGCKWYLRVAKLKNSDCFSVRTHNKMHTCARATSSSSGSRKRRKGTPRLVASVLREGYEGQFDTPPTPKDIIGLVEKKFGVKVSYSTALRGKKQVANDVRDSNNSMDQTAQ